MPYIKKGKCVYKKDTGAKVGCTKGDVDKYLTALRMHAESTISETNIIKGGLADGMTLTDLAKKHNISLDSIKNEFKKGVQVELEHTDDIEIAKEIATDHLYEDPKYYTKLKTIEESIKRKLTELYKLKDLPSNIIYNIKYHGRDAGKLTIGKAVPELGDDTAEIIDVKMNEGYNDLNTTIKAVNHIWNVLPEVQRLVVTVTPENMYLWEKLGFQRLNNTYWISTRGH